MLVNETKRTFRLERKVYMSFYGHDYAELETSDDLETLADMVCQHIGYPTYFNLAPKGWEDGKIDRFEESLYLCKAHSYHDN